MGTAIVIVFGFVSCVGVICYFEFKKKELEYNKECVSLSDTVLKRDIERERTEQLRIKSNYRDKHGERLYN